MAINVSDNAGGHHQPLLACGLCLKFPLRVMVDGMTTVCEYCDVGGNPLPPIGGFPDDDDDDYIFFDDEDGRL